MCAVWQGYCCKEYKLINKKKTIDKNEPFIEIQRITLI